MRLDSRVRTAACLGSRGTLMIGSARPPVRRPRDRRGCGARRRATDGEIGQVQGLAVEPGGHQVTHVLLQKGHLPGRRKVAIPISAVTKIGTMLIHRKSGPCLSISASPNTR